MKTPSPRPHFNRAIAALVTSLALAGCATPFGGSAPDAASSSEDDIYRTHQLLWSGGELHPVPAARLAVGAGYDKQVRLEPLRTLQVGMIETQLTQALGEPAAQDGQGLRQYVARDEQGLFVASLWFNERQRLWLGSVALPALPELAASFREPLKARILFGSGSALLSPMARQTLSQVAKQAPQALQLTGYADRRGSMLRNESLARQRVEAVRRQLIQLDVKPERIKVQGVAVNVTEVACAPELRGARLNECLAPDRRVDIVGGAAHE